ncbi:lysozyme inhibitor LprI family protein [Paraburkholderia phytofirmans]|uniref:lysozyme inhibitor LprI family protein n=1 Tax=Paraburkholderia phytofirmans TaxID=261302 RepID=UPI0038B8FD14
MKRFIIAAAGLLIAGHVFAAEVSCEKFGEMAYNATVARDRGTPQDEVARTLAKNYGDDRAQNLTKVVFMHSEMDADTMQFASRTRCLQLAGGINEAKSTKAAAPGAVKLATKEPAREFEACMDKSGGVTAAMLDCIGAETKRQDVLLNANYQAATKVLSADRRQKLVAAQRAWLAYRTAETNFTADPDGGTSAQVNAADEFRQMTAQRAQELGRIAAAN